MSRPGRNAKVSALLEPMWAIPYNLFITYASVYMLALGTSEKQIGLIASITLVFQIFFSFISGPITDKLGRKKTSLIFDLISWSIPTLIWAFAQNFYYFLIAGIINSAVRVVHTSWTCLFIEDTLAEDRVKVYTWIEIGGILSGFFAPLSGFFVKKYEMVPTVRVLYLIAFVSMTSLFILRHFLTEETAQGIRRMEETKDEKFFEGMKGYGDVARSLISNPYTIVAFFFSVFLRVHAMIRANFFAIILTKKLNFSQGSIALFPAIQSSLMLVVYLFIMPWVSRRDIKRPLLTAFISLTASNVILVLAPKESYVSVIISTLLMAYGTAISSPITESILANSLDEEDRARMMSILYVFLYGFTAPFGYIGGLLASRSEELPFMMMVIAFIISSLLVYFLYRLDRKEEALEGEGA